MNLVSKKNNTERISFGYRSHHFACPNLLDIQLDSFEWLVSKKPAESGLYSLFNEFFPITSTDKQKRQLKIVFKSFRLTPPVCSIADAKKYEVNYEARLFATFQLVDVKTDEVLDDAEVFITALPLIINKGNFIINGGEKVIVSQIVRSPAPFFSETYDSKIGYNDYKATIIPLRGAWLEFDIVKNNKSFLRIDRSRKIDILTFLKGLDLPNELIKDWYQNTVLPVNEDMPEFKISRPEALFEVFHKIRPGDPFSVQQAIQYIYWLLFDIKRSNLSRAGRYKINNKLALQARVYGLKLAENVIDDKDNVILKTNTTLSGENYKKFCQALADGHLDKDVILHTEELNQTVKVKHPYQTVKVFNEEKKVCTLIGVHPSSNLPVQNCIDIFATLNYLLHLKNGIGVSDDIDDLSNRRIRTAGELIQNQLRIGLSRVEKSICERLSVAETLSNSLKKIIPYLPVANALKEFFNTSQLCQYMDQVNPVSELSHKRRITALGPGGLTRDRANIDVRDVHNSYYGRICPIETPEGPNIGLINNLCCYARINEYGFIETPYFKVKNGIVSSEFEYLSAAEESKYVITQANSKLDKKNRILEDQVICRINSQNVLADSKDVDFMDVSPKQIVSVAAATIPFLEHNDSSRALMGCNMCRQAVPLLQSEAPLIGTGFEKSVAKYSGLSVVTRRDGEVCFVDAKEIVIQEKDSKRKMHYPLTNFEPSNQGSPLHQTPIVKLGDQVKAGDVIADGSGIKNGEVSLGKNLLVAFNVQKGFNYEDAFVVSERLVKEDVYTSLHIEEHTLEFRKTRLGNEEMTRDIPNVSETAKRFLDDDGLIIPGSEVKAGDVLVGKITPKGTNMTLSAEDRLLQAIFGKKSYSVQNNSLRVPNGGDGVVLDVHVFEAKKSKDSLAAGVIKIAKVYIIQKRKIQEGDKMSGRHGNKGVIAKVLPVEDMPFMDDGTPVDIVLNPLSVPPRMNIGQILELHLGLIAKQLGIKVAVPIFEGLGSSSIEELMKQAKIENYGRFVLTDGITGKKFNAPVTVGIMYVMKLSHMVDDKLHARCTGPYSLVTQQPLGGKAQNGGQRFGEMEGWSIMAYGAANFLREMLTIKSDDIQGRLDTYTNIVEGGDIPEPGIPESFLVILKELKALYFNTTYDEATINDEINDNARETEKISVKKDLL